VVKDPEPACRFGHIGCQDVLHAPHPEGRLPIGARFDRALLAGHQALLAGDRKEAERQLAFVQDDAREIQVLERDLALEYYDATTQPPATQNPARGTAGTGRASRRTPKGAP
jgi:hypothetical protein